MSESDSISDILIISWSLQQYRHGHCSMHCCCSHFPDFIIYFYHYFYILDSLAGLRLVYEHKIPLCKCVTITPTALGHTSRAPTAFDPLHLPIRACWAQASRLERRSLPSVWYKDGYCMPNFVHIRSIVVMHKEQRTGRQSVWDRQIDRQTDRHIRFYIRNMKCNQYSPLKAQAVLWNVLSKHFVSLAKYFKQTNKHIIFRYLETSFCQLQRRNFSFNWLSSEKYGCEEKRSEITDVHFRNTAYVQ